MKVIRILVIILIVGVLAGLYFSKNKNTQSEISNTPITTNVSNVEETIKSGKPIIIDFGAEWCGPCKQFHPIIEKMQEKYKDVITIEYVDVDKNPDLAKQYPVEAIPCQVFIVNGKAYEPKNVKTELTSVTKDGNKITYHIGGIPEEEFEEIIKDMINKN